MPEELTRALNRLAGFNDPLKQKGAAGAANAWAGTTGLELVGALNVKAGRPADGSALELNGVLQRLGLAGADRNSALATVVNVLRLPGVSGNYVSAPDSAALSVTGDIDLRAKVALDSWTPGVTQRVIAKQSSGTTRSFYFGVNPVGRLDLSWSVDGTAVIADGQSAAFTIPADHAVLWIRATLDVDNGAAGRTLRYYTSTDGTTWTQVGTDIVTAGVTSIFDSTSPVEIGARGSGTVETTSGTIYYASVRNGIDGVIVGEFDATKVGVTGLRTPTAYADAYSNTWTVNGSDWWWTTPTLAAVPNAIHLDTQYVYFPGTTGNYASTPDSAALSITGDIDLRIKMAMDDWTPTTTAVVIAKWQTSTTRSYRFGINTSGQPFIGVSTDGSAQITVGSTAATGFADGAVGWVRVTRASASGSCVFYKSNDGVTWTTLATVSGASGAIFDSTSQVEIAAQDAGSTNFLAGKVYYAEIRNGIGGSVVGAFSPQRVRVTAVRTPSTLSDPISGTWTLNGSAWEWVPAVSPLISTPDSAALSITGDLDLRIKLTLHDLYGLGVQGLIGKRSGASGGYQLRFIGATKRVELVWADGTTTFFKNGGADIPYNPGDTFWLRVTLDVDNGASGNDVKFYTSDDGVAWTQVGTTTTTAGVTSIGDSTDALEIFSLPVDTLRASGTIHYAEVRSGIGGTVVGVFNPQSIRVTSSTTPLTFTSPTGQVWTVSGSGWQWTGVP